MNEVQIRELAETTSRSKSNEDRIEKLEERQELLHDMNKNIAEIAVQTKYTKDEVTELKTDLEVIKSKPNKLVDSAVEKIVTVVIGAIVGAVLALVI